MWAAMSRATARGGAVLAAEGERVPVRLERDDAPARPDDSGDLANDGGRVGYVLERALDPHGVEFVVSEREPVGVGLDETDRRSASVARLRGREELAA
jgi:hypothetical protein